MYKANIIIDVFKLLLFYSINFIISFALTSYLGISNTVLFTSYLAMYGDITWEVVIFIFLSIIEVIAVTLYKYIRYSSIDY